jgi:hypothetical protein
MKLNSKEDFIQECCTGEGKESQLNYMKQEWKILKNDVGQGHRPSILVN